MNISKRRAIPSLIFSLKDYITVVFIITAKLWFLTTCLQENIIPKGFRSKFSPYPGSNTPQSYLEEVNDAKKKYSETLIKATIKLHFQQRQTKKEKSHDVKNEIIS